MKNKKGFTLIELLAVIAILAILVVVAVPAILNLFRESRRNTFITQAQLLFKAAEQKIVSLQISPGSDSTKFCYVYNADAPITLNPIELEGTRKMAYSIEISNDNEITSFILTDGRYSVTRTGTPISISDIDSVDETTATLTTCTE